MIEGSIYLSKRIERYDVCYSLDINIMKIYFGENMELF